MSSREQKGLEIYRRGGIRQTSRGWLVPSQGGNGTYLVHKDGMGTACTCPDCELRGIKCKHQFAVDSFLSMEKATGADGSVTVTKTTRTTYKQDWRNYTEAQTGELKLFPSLLKDLVEVVPESMQHYGRPRMPLSEGVFCAVNKVWSQLSSRRAHYLYTSASGKGYIGKAPNYNAINKLLNRQELTPILERLLTISAMPLRSVETTFAPDSSGFRTSKFGQYAVEKYGTMKKHRWVKAHVLVGTKTNVIVAARVTEENCADSPQFRPLVEEAHESGFGIEEIAADMGYSSRDNYNLAREIGATAYIPFKSNATGKAGGSMTWRKAYHFFQLHREEFMEHYHVRSNVESVFSMVKAKFGDRLKSKNFTAQRNELLCKLVAHNIVVLIHELHGTGIDGSSPFY